MEYTVDETLVGREYVFDDGDKIKVLEIKKRNDQWHLVSVLIQQGPGIPRKLVLHYEEFQEYYGHLFRKNTVMPPSKHWTDSKDL